MDVEETFGKAVTHLCETHHTKAATSLLNIGWRVQSYRMAHFPDKRLTQADRFLSAFLMRSMSDVLRHPERSAMVSIFTPCEMILEAGFNPYSVEAFSSYITGSKAEGICIKNAASAGIPETLCSYHRVFTGAEGLNIIKKPRFIVYTNLICDANMLTFKYLKDKFNVPAYFIDVPQDINEDSLDRVEEQIRGLEGFIYDVTGVRITEEGLRKRVNNTRQSVKNYYSFLEKRGEKYIQTDVTVPMFQALANNVLMGSEDELKYTEMILEEVERAPAKRGKHIYFMHTIPFWSKALRDRFSHVEGAQIVGDELSNSYLVEYETENPYRAMAYRMLHNQGNGPITRRIEHGIRIAKLCKADGVIWFNHWGCKHTLGGSVIAKRLFEEAGIKTLVLDGDGCDSSFGSEGQMGTRIDAFLEMLGE